MDGPHPPLPPGFRPLWRNALWTIGGTGFYHACQLGVLVLLAKFASPSIQGQYVLALALATPVVLFFGLELRSAYVSDAAERFSLSTYATLRRRSLLVAVGVLLGVLVWQAAGRAAPASYALILAGVFAARSLWGWAELGWGVYQRRERLDLLGISIGLRGLALLLPFAVVVPLYYSLTVRGNLAPGRLAEGAALAALLHALGFAAVWLLFDRRRATGTAHPGRERMGNRASRGSGHNAGSAVRTLAVQTLPLGVVALVINLCESVPRVVLEHQPDGKAWLGYFGALAYITLAGNLVVIQTMTAAASRLAVHYQRDLRAFLRLGARLIAAAAVVGGSVLVVAWMFGGWILKTLYTAEYAQFETEFRIVVVASCLALLTNVLGAATTQMRLFWVQVPAQATTLAATIVAAVLLIPGATPVLGAAQTLLVRAVVQFAVYAACAGWGVIARPRILARA